ncbi:hypothetical protein ACSBR2_028750 [Camellia fascicularis]
MVRNMPMEPNAYVWGALLNSCRMHKNTDVAEETASRIFRLESKTTGSYMLLSNIYAPTGRWEDSAREYIGNGMEEVYEMLKDLGLQMEIEGYLPEESFVPQDLGESFFTTKEILAKTNGIS